MTTLATVEMIEQLIIKRARRDLLQYRKFMNPKLKVGWFVRDMTAGLQKFYEDLRAGKRPILFIEAPPQHGKSEAVGAAIEWMVGLCPNLKVIYASFSERLGVRANRKMQRALSSKKYQKVFPNTKINERNSVATTGYQRNSEMIEFVDTGGSFRNTTIGGSVTGETLQVGIIDDPVKGREAANSKTVRNKTWDWFNDDFYSRFDEFAGLIIILTRWHIDDLVGRLKEQGEEDITVLSYKAIAEKDEEHRKAGEALFPEHKSLEFLLKRKKRYTDASWQSLYQQNPIVIGGNLFKAEHWQYYTALPRLDYRIITGDTAMKTAEQNDYSVLQCWGKSYDGKAYLIDQIRGKWEAPELKVQTQAFWNKHQAETDLAYLRSLLIEDKASGTGLIQTIRKESNIPVIAIQRNTDKIMRANDVIPAIESGNVFLPEGASFLSDFLEEASQFPNGSHDDQLDPMMDAVMDITGNQVEDYGSLR